MKEILFFIIIFIISAIAHERDISRTCREEGNSNYAGWTVEIKCSEMKESK